MLMCRDGAQELVLVEKSVCGDPEGGDQNPQLCAALEG